MVASIIQGILAMVQYKQKNMSPNCRATIKTLKENMTLVKIVQTIVNYQKKFIVIEKKCKIKKIQKKHKDCSLVKKNENYVLLYSSYLDSIMLSSLLTDYSIDYYKLLQISKTLVNRIHDLAHANVVHMDLHFGNILWSKKTKVCMSLIWG